MGQELKSRVAVVGGGPAGCMCAYFLQNDFDVTVFEASSPLKTLLPTGGGKCNICHAEFDFKELAKNYPRGEKFLYSVFSKFSTYDTIEFFKNIGVESYIREDFRVFPVSNSSKDVREKFLKNLNKVRFIKEEVLRINPGFQVVTNMNSYKADYVVIASGGHASYELIRLLGHKIVEPKPALTGLVTKEDLSKLAGVSINGVLFTHKGVSGPEVYKISSIKARENFPYSLSFDFIGNIDLQIALNENSHKSIKNLMSEYVPKSFAQYVLEQLGIDPDEKCHKINGKIRDNILDKMQNFTVTAVKPVPDGEVVTCGGVDLKEINPKTMESKIANDIYFCGEVMDIDGFCGGFNLQNCWSTGYLAACSILSKNRIKNV